MLPMLPRLGKREIGKSVRKGKGGGGIRGDREIGKRARKGERERRRKIYQKLRS